MCSDEAVSATLISVFKCICSCLSDVFLVSSFFKVNGDYAWQYCETLLVNNLAVQLITPLITLINNNIPDNSCKLLSLIQ